MIPGEDRSARFPAVGVSVNRAARTMTYDPRWTVSRDAWKSSPSPLPHKKGPPLVVAGVGIGSRATGAYGVIDPAVAFGRLVAIDPSGDVGREQALGGNIRGSTAVADGATGELVCVDASGTLRGKRALGPRTIAGPSIGDLDGNGTLEIVIACYDGRIHALGGTR